MSSIMGLIAGLVAGAANACAGGLSVEEVTWAPANVSRMEEGIKIIEETRDRCKEEACKIAFTVVALRGRLQQKELLLMLEAQKGSNSEKRDLILSIVSVEGEKRQNDETTLFMKRFLRIFPDVRDEVTEP